MKTIYWFAVFLALSIVSSVIFALISLGETRKSFDLIAAEESDRRFYVGADTFLYEKIEVRNLQALFRVTEGGNAKGGIFLDVYNISDKELSPTFIFVLPSDVKNVTTSSAGFVQTKPYGTIVRIPQKLAPYAYPAAQPSVQFTWPSFGNSTKSGEWIFFIKGDPEPVKYRAEGNSFYQFQQFPSNRTIPMKISVYVAPYQLVGIYPESSAENYLGRAVWKPESTQTIYEAFGYYSDNSLSAIMEYIKQIVLIALGAFGFATAQKGYQFFMTVLNGMMARKSEFQLQRLHPMGIPLSELMFLFHQGCVRATLSTSSPTSPKLNSVLPVRASWIAASKK